MELATVQCDEPGCGWSKRLRLESVPRWHSVACPKCGRGEIVNAHDLAIWGMLMGMKAAGMVSTSGKPNLRVDTSGMRAGRGVDVVDLTAARARQEA